MTQEPVTYRLGILFMADVVDYTPQSRKLGDQETETFNHQFENKIRALSDRYGGEFIRRIGDGILLFFSDQKLFLDFVIQLRDYSRTRKLDSGEFFADIRMVAHFGNFSMKEIEGKISHLIGSEGIKLFRMEKYAGAYDILVTEFCLAVLEPLLREKNIESDFSLRTQLKGFDLETSLFKLIFREASEEHEGHLLNQHLDALWRDCCEIPVFGDIYPPMSMADNFVNLDLKTGLPLPSKGDTDHGIVVGEGVDGWKIRKKKKRKENKLDVQGLYGKHRRGIIMGLPGAGKTTILKYFAYRDISENRKDRTPGNQRIVLLIECRNIKYFSQWYRERYGIYEDTRITFNTEKILQYLTHCFLFKRASAPDDREETIKAEKLVQQAYYQGRLNVLIDALDETPSKKEKENLVELLRFLFNDCNQGTRLNNRLFLTTRYSEKERYFSGDSAETLKPLFEVRPLDMEQLRDMARFFYKGNTDLYDKFDDHVWREEVAAKVGGTPLTALLVIAYFEIFKKFDTRYLMYNIIVVFILIQVWKQMKENKFKRDMRAFFREAKSKSVLEDEKNAKEIYDALTVLSYEHLDQGRVMKEGDILGIFSLFAHKTVGERLKDSEAEQWLERLREDHLLVSAGTGEYVFIHSTVMEYLAARYIVEKIGNPDYLKEFSRSRSLKADLEKKQPVFYESEIFPIAVGSDIPYGTRILKFLRMYIKKNKDNRMKLILFNLAFKCLVEFESFVDRQYRSKQLEILHQEMENAIKAEWNAIDWVYKYLREIVLSNKKQRLKLWVDVFKNISKLSRPIFLDIYLPYETFTEGDSETVSLRETLIYSFINQELVERWLDSHLKEKEKLYTQIDNFLDLDTSAYHPEDKNFKYYRQYSGSQLVGLLGSPNMRLCAGVDCLAVSPGAKYLASGSDDSIIKIWDIDTGREVKNFDARTGSVWSISFSPDSHFLLVGMADDTVKMWNFATGKEISVEKRSYWEDETSGRVVCYSPDNKYIAICHSNKTTFKLWDAANLKGGGVKSFSGHNYPVTCIRFSHDNRHVLSGSDDSYIKLWDIEKAETIHTFRGHEKSVSSICLTKDGKQFVSGSSDGTAILWDIHTGKILIRCKGHMGVVKSVHFTPDQKYIISGSSDGTIKLWDRITGELVKTFQGHTGQVNSVCTGKDNQIISGSEDSTIKRWSPVSGKEILAYNGHHKWINSIGFSTDGKQLISASEDSTIKLWNVETGQMTKQFRGHLGNVWSTAFNPSGNQIISASEDFSIKIWDISTGKEIRSIRKENQEIICARYSPDGAWIISSTSDGNLTLWDKQTGTELGVYEGLTGRIPTVEFNPGGSQIVAGADDTVIRIWDVTSGTLLQTLLGHGRGVTCVCFSPDGTQVVSGSNDSKVKIWDAQTGNIIQTLSDCTRGITGVCFNQNGKYVLACSWERTITVWFSETGRLIHQIKLLWIPKDIKENPAQPGVFAVSNANGTVVLFNFRDILN